MKRDNDLDDFYKRRLEDAAVTPPEDVWDAISSRLPEKKSRVLPLWYKIAGAAAVAVLLVSLGGGILEPSPLPSDNPSTYSPAISFRPEIELDTEEFEKVMKESSNLLRSLTQETEKRRFLNGGEEPVKENDHSLATQQHNHANNNKVTSAETEESLAANPSTGMATRRTATFQEGTAGSFRDSVGKTHTFPQFHFAFDQSNFYDGLTTNHSFPKFLFTFDQSDFRLSLTKNNLSPRLGFAYERANFYGSFGKVPTFPQFLFPYIQDNFRDSVRENNLSPRFDFAYERANFYGSFGKVPSFSQFILAYGKGDFRKGLIENNSLAGNPAQVTLGLSHTAQKTNITATSALENPASLGTPTKGQFAEIASEATGPGNTKASKDISPVSTPNLHSREPVTEPSPSHQGELAASKEEFQQDQGLIQASEQLGIQEEEVELASGLEHKNLNQHRLSISTKVAPVLFNTGGGNALDSQFSNNSASGEVSVSYGISFAYRISRKIKLRSGVSRVDLAHQTRNVSYNAAVNSATLDNAPKTLVLASPMAGNLNQQMGFTEVPVEMEYLLTDKRFGLSLLLGASSLFLDENNISLDASTFSTDLGEANNLNELSFSANIGLGLNYKLAPQFQLNVEPILKYQLNTFRTSSLRPYYFGLYSGFTFNF